MENEEKRKMLEKAALKEFEKQKADILKTAKEKLEFSNWQLLTLAKILVLPIDLDRARIWISILTDFDPVRKKITFRAFRVPNAKITIVDYAVKYFNYEADVPKGGAVDVGKDKFAKYTNDSHENALSGALISGERFDLIIEHKGILQNGEIVSKWDELIIID